MKNKKQKNITGLTFAKEVASVNFSSIHFAKIMRSILSILTTITSIFCFISSYDIDIDKKTVLIAVLLISFMFNLELYFEICLREIIAGWLVIICSYIIIYFHELQKGYYVIKNCMLVKILNYYNQSYDVMSLSYDNSSDMATIAIIFVALIVSFLIGVFIVYTFKPILSVILSLVLVVSGVFFAFMPDVELLYMLTAIYISIFIMIVSRDNENIYAHNCIFAFIISLLLFAGIGNIYPHENYDRESINKSLTDLTESIGDSKIGDFLFDFLGLSNGGINEGDLTSTGELKYDHDTDLIVDLYTTGNKKSIYLRGYIGSVYTGSRFDKLSSSDYSSYSALFDAIDDAGYSVIEQPYTVLNSYLDSYSDDDFNLFEGYISITNVGASNNYTYSPYYSDVLANADEEELSIDSTITTDDKTSSYSFYTLPSSSLNNAFSFISYSNAGLSDSTPEPFSNYSSLMEMYTDFVYNVYTRLPNEGIDDIIETYSPNKLSVRGDLSLYDYYIDYVKDEIQKDTSYSLAPGTTPNDKDFVSYFLYENKKGFCCHYAAAATVIFRALGIPARYVEGYTITASDYNDAIYDYDNSITLRKYTSGNEYTLSTVKTTVELDDSRAHAWVEIYVDNIGWVPVEVTPSNNSTEDTSNESIIEEDTTPAVEDTTEASTEVESLTEESEETIEDESNDTANDIEDNSNDDSSSSDEGNTLSKVLNISKIVFKIVGIPILIFLVILIRAHLIIKKRLRSFTSKNQKLRLVNVNKSVNRLLKYLKISTDESSVLYGEYKDYIKDNVSYLSDGSYDRYYEIYKKAVYSPVAPDTSEIKYCIALYKKLQHSIYADQKGIRRFIFKYILVL